MPGPATAHDMAREIVSIISWTLLVCAACFGQIPLHQLVAGQSTRTDVERVAGKPVAVYSQTLVEKCAAIGVALARAPRSFW